MVWDFRLCNFRDLIPARTAWNTPKRKQNLKSHPMTPLKTCANVKFLWPRSTTMSCEHVTTIETIVKSLYILTHFYQLIISAGLSPTLYWPQTFEWLNCICCNVLCPISFVHCICSQMSFHIKCTFNCKTLTFKSAIIKSLFHLTVWRVFSPSFCRCGSRVHPQPVSAQTGPSCIPVLRGY